jgi:hypothetical protein
MPIVLNWREGMPLATMHGQYQVRHDQSVDFFYYPDQLALSLALTKPS